MNDPEERKRWVEYASAHPEEMSPLWVDLGYSPAEAAEMCVDIMRYILSSHDAAEFVLSLLKSGLTEKDKLVIAVLGGITLGEAGAVCEE